MTCMSKILCGCGIRENSTGSLEGRTILSVPEVRMRPYCYYNLSFR